MALLPLISLALPTAALAATPQQIFNRSVDATFKKGAPLRVDVKMSIQTKETSANKTANGEADIHAMLRYRQERAGRQDSEGQVVINKIKSAGIEGWPPISWQGPLTFEWKHIDQTAYVRVKTRKLQSDVEQFLGPDIMKLFGQWLMMSSAEAKQNLQSLDAQVKQIVPLKVSSIGLSSNHVSELKKMQVVKVEKMEKRKNGDLIYRLRLRINPAEIDKAEKIRLAAISKEKEDKLANISKMSTDSTLGLNAADVKRLRDSAVKTADDDAAAARKDFARQREYAKHSWFAVTVNATRNTLERFEAVSRTSGEEPATKTAPAKTWHADLNIGASFLRDGDWSVETPKNSLDMKEIFAALTGQSTQKAAVEMQAQAPSSQASAPVVGLTDEYIDNTNGFKVDYPHGWASQSGQGSITLTSDTKEDGIPPELAVWSFDAISGLDEDAMIQSVIGQVRDNLLLTAVEKDGWTYTLTAPEAVTAKNTMDGFVAGKSFLMTRNTDLGVVVTRIEVFPNVAGDKYLAVIFHEPLVPSAALAKARDAILDSFTLIIKSIP
jgi:DNA-binding transcriptional regulator YiaG